MLIWHLGGGSKESNFTGRQTSQGQPRSPVCWTISRRTKLRWKHFFFFCVKSINKMFIMNRYISFVVVVCQYDSHWRIFYYFPLASYFYPTPTPNRSTQIFLLLFGLGYEHRGCMWLFWIWILSFFFFLNDGHREQWPAVHRRKSTETKQICKVLEQKLSLKTEKFFRFFFLI